MKKNNIVDVKLPKDWGKINVNGKKVDFGTLKGVNVNKVLNDIKKQKRAEKEFHKAIDNHLKYEFIFNHMPKRKENLTLSYCIACSILSALITYITILWIL